MTDSTTTRVQAALAEFNKLAQPLRMYFTRNARQPADAEDLCSEVAVRFLAAANQGQEIGRVGPFVWGIAKNVQFEYIRRVTSAKTTSLEERIESGHEPASPLSPDSEFDRDVFGDEGETRLALRECISELPKEHRDVIEQYYAEDDHVAARSELADRDRRSTGALYSLLTRIRQRLRRCVEGKFGAGATENGPQRHLRKR